VSTPIRDVVRPYGELGLAYIAHNADEFVAQLERALRKTTGLKRRERVDVFLRSLSWDSIWSSMNTLLNDAVASRRQAAPGGNPDLLQEAAYVG
jgi:hypothetical protein